MAIPIEELNTTLYSLQKLLNGYNYEVVMGVEIFANCKTLEDVKLCLENKFPRSNPEVAVSGQATLDQFWQKLEFALEYRGDNVAGVELSGPKLDQFLQLKESLLSFLGDNIQPDSKIYFYSEDEGIPGYAVWWDFRFIILSSRTNALFVYGAASD